MTFTPPGEQLADRGAQAHPAHHGAARRARPRGGVGRSVPARPPRGRHRPEAAQQPRGLRQAQAARRLAAPDDDPRSDLVVLSGGTSRRSRASSATSASPSATTSPRTSPASRARSRVKIYGDDLDRRSRGRPRRRRRHLRASRARPTWRSSRAARPPQLRVKLDRRRARPLRPRSGRRAGLHRDRAWGPRGSELWEGERRFDVTRAPAHPSTREDVERSARCCFPLDDGSLIPLSAARRREDAASAAPPSRARTAGATSASA